jgi:hypothetical protein
MLLLALAEQLWRWSLPVAHPKVFSTSKHFCTVLHMLHEPQQPVLPKLVHAFDFVHCVDSALNYLVPADQKPETQVLNVTIYAS